MVACYDSCYKRVGKELWSVQTILSETMRAIKDHCLPERPLWRLAMDLFEKNQKMYLLVLDYFSRFITVHELKNSSIVIVKVLEELFCSLGLPSTIISSN